VELVAVLRWGERVWRPGSREVESEVPREIERRVVLPKKILGESS
jgi:hypothetical protein